MQPADVIRFWCDDCTPEEWYQQSDDLDATIRTRFGEAVTAAQGGAFAAWEETAEGALALLILLDQFSRNIFRGDARSFAGDARARQVARKAIARDFDQAFPMPRRQFFFMPLVHSESIGDQEDGVLFMAERLGEDRAKNLLHARAHREVIAQFGRFPFRNAALGRETTDEEQAFLDAGGYRTVVNALEADAANAS